MKRTSSAILFAALSGTLAAPPAFPQDPAFPQNPAPQSRDPFELESVHSLTWRGDAGLVLLGGDTPDDSIEMLADLELGLDFESFTDLGRRWGFVLTGHAERDLPGAAHGGRVGSCPAAVGDCARVGTVAAPQTPIASDSGLFSDGAFGGDRSRAAISEAYLFTDTGWGEVRLGYGAGAARLDPVGGPATARLVRADGGHLRASAVTAVRTEAPHSGQDPKFVFRSVALGQETTVGTVRAAVSFTPEVSQCGVDYCPRGTGPGGQVGAINRDVAELALTYQVRRGEHEWAASLSASQAGRVEGEPGFEPVSGVDAGLSWRWQDWRAGGRWRRSNNAVSGSGDYEAWASSIGWESGDWLTTLEFAASSDDFVHSDSEIWQIASSRLVGDHGLVAFGLQAAETSFPESSGPGRVQREVDAFTAFLELGWRY